MSSAPPPGPDATITRSDADRLEPIRRTCLRLGTGELAAAAVFAGVAAIRVAPRLDPTDRVAMWMILAPLLTVLVEAGVFWLLARSWLGQRPMPRGLARVYAGFGGVNVILLGIGFVGLTTADVSLGVRLLFASIWLFGLIEVINYFVVRLAYPASTWLTEVGRWRRPRLVAEVRAGLRETIS